MLLVVIVVLLGFVGITIAVALADRRAGRRTRQDAPDLFMHNTWTVDALEAPKATRNGPSATR